MCESCVFLSMKSLYDELDKVCSVSVHVLCVHVWSNSLIASLLLLSSLLYLRRNTLLSPVN